MVKKIVNKKKTNSSSHNRVKELVISMIDFRKNVNMIISIAQYLLNFIPDTHPYFTKILYKAQNVLNIFFSIVYKILRPTISFQSKLTSPGVHMAEIRENTEADPRAYQSTSTEAGLSISLCGYHGYGRP